MQWQIIVPAGRIPSGGIGTVVLSTTSGLQAFDCPQSGGGAGVALKVLRAKRVGL
jgi:hypothetical protein